MVISLRRTGSRSINLVLFRAVTAIIKATHEERIEQNAHDFLRGKRNRVGWICACPELMCCETAHRTVVVDGNRFFHQTARTPPLGPFSRTATGGGLGADERMSIPKKCLTSCKCPGLVGGAEASASMAMPPPHRCERDICSRYWEK